MPVLASISFSICLVSAVLFGAQTRPWSWGPALLFLALALAASIPSILREKKLLQPYLFLICLLTTAWYLFRAWVSPVKELAIADILLVTSTISSFLVIRTILKEKAGGNIFIWTLVLLTLSSSFVIFAQVRDPSFAPIFEGRPVTLPSGFFGHYNDGANFLIATSFLVGSSALFGCQPKPIRFIWGIVAILGLVAIYFTRSRGALLATGASMLAFFTFILILAKIRGCRWFGPAVIAIPISAIIATGLIWYGLSHTQEFRFQADISKLMDGNIRLFLYGISISCIITHPWAGGGSRSFSWECNQFWTKQDHGQESHSLDFVHNEFLQATSDYGIVGSVLLALCLCWAFGLFINYSISSDDRSLGKWDSIRLGAAAALIGMLVQSNFSFVFHLLPGPILLGVCFAMLSFPNLNSTQERSSIARSVSMIAISTSLLTCALLYGWKGTQVLIAIWPAFFEKNANAEERLTGLSRGINIWPQATFYRERALLLHRSTIGRTITSPTQDPAIINSIDDYRSASKLHPLDSSIAVNLANLLSLAGRDTEAEIEFRYAVNLQGGMEAAYKANLFFSEHYARKANRELDNEDYESALPTLLLGVKQLDFLEHQTPGVVNEPRGITLRRSLFSNLATTYERLGNLESALFFTDKAATIPNNSSAHYHASMIIGNMAKTAWSERRPSEALTRFQEARKRIDLATELPPGVTTEMKAEYTAFWEHSIQYLIEAKVQPLKSTEE